MPRNCQKGQLDSSWPPGCSLELQGARVTHMDCPLAGRDFSWVFCVTSVHANLCHSEEKTLCFKFLVSPSPVLRRGNERTVLYREIEDDIRMAALGERGTGVPPSQAASALA